ncbi:MAG: NUDIX hydrolase, partial [Bdellovibrionales bacterium]
ERSGDAWDLPGGGLEAGESYYDALVRETPEETRLCAPCVYPYFYTYEDGTDGKLAYAAMTFIAFYGDSYTPIVDGEEHAGFLWQPLDRLQSPRTRRFDTFLRESSIQQRGFTEIKAGLGGIRPLDMHLRGGATQPFPQPPF